MLVRIDGGSLAVKVKSKVIVRKFNDIKDEKLNGLTLNFDHMSGKALFSFERKEKYSVYYKLDSFYKAYYILYNRNKNDNDYAYIFLCIDKNTSLKTIQDIKDKITSNIVFEKMTNDKDTHKIDLYNFIIFLADKRLS